MGNFLNSLTNVPDYPNYYTDINELNTIYVRINFSLCLTAHECTPNIRKHADSYRKAFRKVIKTYEYCCRRN